MRGRKKVKLTKLQQMILEFPPEDGLASIVALLGHLEPEFRGYTGDELIEATSTAIIKLRRLGDLYVELQFESERYSLRTDDWKEFALSNFVCLTENHVNRFAAKNCDDVLVQLTQGGVNDLKLSKQQMESSRKTSYPAIETVL